MVTAVIHLQKQGYRLALITSEMSPLYFLTLKTWLLHLICHLRTLSFKVVEDNSLSSNGGC